MHSGLAGEYSARPPCSRLGDSAGPAPNSHERRLDIAALFCQDRRMLGGSDRQNSLTRTALSRRGRAKSEFPSVVVVLNIHYEILKK